MRFLFVVGLATLAGCSGKKDKEPDPKDTTPEVGELVRSDGGITAVITDIDPMERHVDEPGTERPIAPQPPANRPGRPIDVTLRSTPPGAQVAVDGSVIGTTPSFWSGMADGREHEFVFTMRGHAIARYRFVPIASGVIHGRLDPIHEERTGSTTPPPEVVPPRPPTTPSVKPPTEPPTMVQPDASVSVMPPGAPEPAAAATPTGSAASPVGPQP
jgi:hypothetical protein